MSASTEFLRLASALSACLDAIGMELAIGDERLYQAVGRERSTIDCDANAEEIVLTLRGSATRILVEKLLS